MEVGGFSYSLWVASAIPLATFALGALSWKILGRWTFLLIASGIAVVCIMKFAGA